MGLTVVNAFIKPDNPNQLNINGDPSWVINFDNGRSIVLTVAKTNAEPHESVFVAYVIDTKDIDTDSNYVLLATSFDLENICDYLNETIEEVIALSKDNPDGQTVEILNLDDFIKG